MILRPFIKWSGSKRSQSKEIVSYFPSQINNYYEPFLGSGAILGYLKANKVIASDINKPLIELWCLLQKDYKKVANEYRKKWNLLQNSDYTFYYKIRKEFNKKQSPFNLLFLTRTCVNGLIRYNKKGEFNNSLHHTRKGINPDQLEKILFQWHEIIKNYNFVHQDYRQILKTVKSGDFVYLDPPYFNSNNRYFGAIDYDDFISFLNLLNQKNVKFALSYDGKRGEKSYIVEIPKNIYKRHLLINSGNSTFNKVQNKKIEKVQESLYLNY